jgi:hypothetical protein
VLFFLRRLLSPKTGYYLDHVVDAFSTTGIGLGIGLAPHVDLAIALGLVVPYLALSINVYIELSVFSYRLAKLEPQRFRWWERHEE